VRSAPTISLSMSLHRVQRSAVISLLLLLTRTARRVALPRVAVSPGPHLAAPPVCRYCLASLKVNNPRNAADVTHAVRTNANLAKDFLRLREAAQLLGCGVAPPQPTPKAVQQASARASRPLEYH